MWMSTIGSCTVTSLLEDISYDGCVGKSLTYVCELPTMTLRKYLTSKYFPSGLAEEMRYMLEAPTTLDRGMSTRHL